MRSCKRRFCFTAALFILAAALLFAAPVSANAGGSLDPASGLDLLSQNLNLFNSPENSQRTIQIILILTVLTLAPSILIMMTAFTRIIITLSFIRNAMGTQQMPTNQVLIGLALFLTLFIMYPTIDYINREAYTPYMAGQISDQVALDRASFRMKEFMLNQVQQADLEMFTSIAEMRDENLVIESPDDVTLPILIPAFITSEIKLAFQMGFMIYLPFIVIDMIVASILMSMGMMMLPPVMISLPFKIMLFVLVDGWGLVIKSLLLTFNI